MSGSGVKSSASSLFSKTKTEFARTKQKALVKMGKAEETVDVTHQQEVQRFEETYDAFRKINKDATRLLDVLKELSIVQASLAEDFYELYESKTELYNAATTFQDVSKNMDNARIAFDETIRNDFIEPISRYLGQYREIKERLKEQDVRKVDMDRYARDVKASQEKAKSGTTSKEIKADTARHNYQSLHEELSQDMPALFADRMPFFNPAMATILLGLNNYYEQCSRTAHDVVPLVSHVNKAAIHHHPRVTTSPEASSSKIKSTQTQMSAPTNPTPNSAYQSNPIPPSFQNSYTPTPSAPAANPSTGRAMPTLPNKAAPLPSPRGAKATALFDFTAQESNELTFKAGDTITITKQTGDWWEGEINGSKGLLPSNYVQLL